jgi:type I restriction enzyme S subunit
VWLLNLDQIEPHTGTLLSKEFVALSGLGSSTHAFDDGNVLYSKLRPYLNKVLLPETAGYCTSELVPMRPNQALVTRKYLAAYLRSPSFLSWVSQQVDGAKMPRVSMKVFWEHRIELPSLDEQQRITTILDKADSLSRKRQEAIRLADAFLQATFFHSFGDADTNRRAWPMVRLEEISLQVTDGEHQTPQRSSAGVYLLSARNVQNGYLALQDVDYVPQEEFERIRRRCEPKRGDILISCSGSIGRVAQVATDDPLALVRSVALVRPETTRVRSCYLEHLLRSASMQRRMVAASKSSAQANLFQGPIRALPVMLPPIEDQVRFERIVARASLLSERSASAANELTALTKSLQSKLLHSGLVQ